MKQENLLTQNIVSIKNLTIDYKMRMFSIRANSDVSLNIKRGSITALVGESGSGKTTLASSLLNNISSPGEITSGEVIFHDKNGQDIVINRLSNDELRKFRWSKISMVFQGAQSSLNPVMTIFSQFKETMKAHLKHVSNEMVMKRSMEVLKIVNLDGERILQTYPHELSGGMKQRVMIAFSLLLEPELIILDEPTTALDVITQDYIFKIFKKINQEMGISLLLLTHDISIVAKYSDYIGVMYGGRLMEYGETVKVFANKYHPYTKGLINATPSLITPLHIMKPIPGNPIDLLNQPKGCVFHPRCESCLDRCKHEEPKLTEIESDHLIYCHLSNGGN